MGLSTDSEQPKRPQGWNDWYRFAQRELGYAHDESAEYANLRFVEEQNRDALRGGADRPSVSPRD
jgi:hypothetical protein